MIKFALKRSAIRTGLAVFNYKLQRLIVQFVLNECVCEGEFFNKNVNQNFYIFYDLTD